jgi:phenylalanyl-tRNA synthetase beta subunit
VSEHANIKNMSVTSFKCEQNPSIKIPVNVDKINQIIGIKISQDKYLSYLIKAWV